MKKLTLLSLSVACSLYAGGYKIPETSVNGVALSAANIAHNKSADTAYYNPANMVFMKDKNALEADLMYISLEATNFKGSGSQAGINIESESETFLIPSINYVSPKLGDIRLGLSIVVPGGLTKRWKTSPAKDKAEEFSLTVIEINPTISYAITKSIAIAAGVRIIHSEGVVKSSGTIGRDMIGESFDYGYNLAFAYKPTKSLDFALTYRSEVDLSEDGTAKLSDATNTVVYDGGASVTVPLPASLSVALAYTLPTKTTVEFVYERNFWSAYSELDFSYAGDIGNLKPYFDDPIKKDWKDTNAYRLGITQDMDKLTLMAGVVFDETPVPDETVSFELPDSDSLSVSLGVRYDVSKAWNIGMSMLYSMREERTVKNDDIDGTFSNSDVLLLGVGVGYKF